jgi:hypothetical protein
MRTFTLEVIVVALSPPQKEPKLPLAQHGEADNMSAPQQAHSASMASSHASTSASSSPSTEAAVTSGLSSGVEFEAQETNDHSDDSSTPSSTRKPMKNVSRERMKAETMFLRDRVQQLERELSQTLAKKALARCATPSPVWRDLAKRQAARREKSEQERDRLRARLLHQLQVAKSLETIFRNRSGEFIDELCASDSGHTPYPVDDMAKLHERFMDEIDQHYPLIDIIFAEPVETPNVAVDMPLRRSTVVSQQTNSGEKLYVELRNTLYMPFPYVRVCDAMWRGITTEYNRQQRVIDTYRCTDDEYTAMFRSQKNPPGSGFQFLSSTTIRRFTEAERTVIVWRSANWDQAPSAKREYGDETGWITVTPLVDAISGERSRDAALVRVCTRYVPIWDFQAKLIEAGASNDTAEQSLAVGAVTNKILNGTEEDIAAITESIENILLDESIGSTDGDLVSMIEELVALPGGHDQELFDSPLLEMS